MSKRNKKNINSYIERVLEIGLEWLGLQRTAANILSLLYTKDTIFASGLSAKEIAKGTGLSQSTVFSVCSNLESLDIVSRTTNGEQNGRGRKSGIYTLTIGIDEILRRGVKKHLDQVDRVSQLVDQLFVGGVSSDDSMLALTAKVADEINLFLSEPYSS